MRDEDFDYFISKFGEATQRTEAESQAIERWRGKLPDRLLAYWQTEGWCGYGDGLFWTVNPDDHEDLVDEWLADTGLEQIDAFHVLARTAFGKLYLFGERTGASVTVSCGTSSITALQKDLRPKPGDELARQIGGFFAFKDRAHCDLKDEAGKPLFDRTLKKLGPLEADEVYGFEPAIVAGGKMSLDNLAKLKLDQHLTILRELGAPSMPFSKVDLDKLLPH